VAQQEPKHALLYKEVVVGIAKMVKFVIDRTGKYGRTISFNKMCEVGCMDKSKDARTIIKEFAYYGFINMKKEWLDKIVAGDYTELCKEVYHEVCSLGYDPGEFVLINNV
jgi:hypothetical protein